MNQMITNNRNNFYNWNLSLGSIMANFNRKNNSEPIVIEDDAENFMEKPRQVFAQPPPKQEISLLGETIPSKDSLNKQNSRKIINKKVNFFLIFKYNEAKSLF